MKIRILFILLSVIFSDAQSYSQEGKPSDNSAVNTKPEQQKIRSLFDKNEKIEHGGWGGFTLGYTKIGGKNAFLSGGRGGWLINHLFTVGLAGYGFVSDINSSNTATPTIDNYSLAGGYGGLLLEPIIAPFNPVHISIPILIGAGGAAIVNNQQFHGYNEVTDYSSCFVLEPGIDIELNIVKFFRLAFNAGYRFTSNVNIDYYSINGIKEFSVPNDALRGFNAGVTFKFGKF